MSVVDHPIENGVGDCALTKVVVIPPSLIVSCARPAGEAERGGAVGSFPQAVGQRAEAFRRRDGRKAALRSGDDVQIMVLQALYSLSDDRAEFMVQERLSFMPFLGLGLGDRAPGCKYDLAVPRASHLGSRGGESVRPLRQAPLRGRLYCDGGQIVDATIISAPKQRNTDAEKADIKAGKAPRSGRISPRSCARRTVMRAGRSSSRRPR